MVNFYGIESLSTKDCQHWNSIPTLHQGNNKISCIHWPMKGECLSLVWLENQFIAVPPYKMEPYPKEALKQRFDLIENELKFPWARHFAFSIEPQVTV